MTDSSPPQLLAEQISDSLFNLLNQSEQPENRAQVLLALKGRADFYWGKDARVSLLLAEMMISLGSFHNDLQYQALGKMAYGDALRFLMRNTEAHHILQEAGDLFKSIPDEVGWARTRIGRLMSSQDFGAEEVQQALADVERAREIFVEHERFDLLVRLSINLAAFHERRLEFQEARAALELGIDSMGTEVTDFRAKLTHNLGILEQVEGNVQAAKTHFSEAEGWFRELGQPQDLARVRASQAELHMLQGRYRNAIHLMQTIDNQLAFNEQVRNRLNQIMCYQLLGAHRQARQVAIRLIEQQDKIHMIDTATAYMYLGETEAELANFPEALAALSTAESLFQKAGSSHNLHDVYMRRAYVHLISSNFQESMDTLQVMESPDLHMMARISLILGRIALQNDNLGDAAAYAIKAFVDSRRTNMPSLYFGVSMLLGNIREKQDRFEKALAHYQQANKLVMHMQRDLTVDFRPGFLESTQAGLRAAIRVTLRQDKIDQAFETLEAMKSLVVFQYLAGHSERDWNNPSTDENTRPDSKREKFRLLRERYLWLIDQETKENWTSIETFYTEKRLIEHDMLELQAAIRLDEAARPLNAPKPDLNAIRSALDLDTALVEFYSDGNTIYAFTLSRNGETRLYQLPASYEDANQLLTALRRIMRRALAVGALDANILYRQGTLDILQKLYEVLLYPLALFLQHYVKIVIVPFGILHSIPFQLLHDGVHYLLERSQVIIQPASGLLTHSSKRSASGALALGYSDGHDGYRMEQEARMVSQLFGGTSHIGQDACCHRLNVSAAQILHIAAHGKYHLNQPRLSHIRLADGLLHADDLDQFDLGYELVTLSACSVGLGHPSGGDELVGLGHSFLYNGAGAVVSSLWEVDDATSEAFMNTFYPLLNSGLSKTEAIQATQFSLMNDSRFNHPAYWGAFQLLGNPAALSRQSLQPSDLIQ